MRTSGLARQAVAPTSRRTNSTLPPNHLRVAIWVRLWKKPEAAITDVVKGVNSAGVHADHHRTVRSRFRASRQSATSTKTLWGDLARLWKAASPFTRSSDSTSLIEGALALNDTRCHSVPSTDARLYAASKKRLDDGIRNSPAM